MAASPSTSSIDTIRMRPPTRTCTARITNLYQTAMNRFLTKRKAKRAGPVEPKVELDLQFVLPSSENFRTSLLMPNLSARFSMLREQDDPMSKLGKAMDDSVLHTRRQSRLYDFGYSSRTLGDIAEVASISSSVRPPFVDNPRSHSFASDTGYHTDDDSSHNGSIMSRAKPGEGNVLFGGRQKIYRIAGGDGRGPNSLKGKALYDDDVDTTTFQKYRQDERQRQLDRERRQQNAQSQGEQKSTSSKPSSSPSVAGSLTRQTSSSTATSGLDSRASTAATSITSQGPPAALSAAPSSISNPFAFSNPQAMHSMPNLERSATKRRLYDQGLDRDFQDQQSSAMTRLNSIQQGRGMNGRGTPDGYQTRPAFGHQDRSQQSIHPFSSPSPDPSRPTTASSSNGPMGLAHQPVSISERASPSPTANQFSRELEGGVLANSINPDDRGKATAMGMFNKPKQFSESKFLERQLTLRKGRDVPVARGEILKDSPKESEEMDREDLDDLPPIDSKVPSASTSHASRSRSSSTTRAQEPPTAPTAFSVFQRAANLIRAANAESVPSTGLNYQDGNNGEHAVPTVMSPMVPKSLRLGGNPHIPTVAPPIAPPPHEHPAFRSATLSSTSSTEDTPDGEPAKSDSPTLGLPNGGLSGLVRQHLRNGSVTSTYSMHSNAGPAPVVGPPAAIHPRHWNTVMAQDDSPRATQTHSSYSHSNPWDLEDYYGPHHGGDPDAHTYASDQLDARPSERDQRRQALPKPSDSDQEGTQWQQELRNKSHSREASTETRHEREAFANELAQRQKAIQEKLKEKAESELLSTSPTTGKSAPFKAMLRQKSSRDSFRSRDVNPKKLLGIGGSTASLVNVVSPVGSAGERPSGDGWGETAWSRSHADSTREGQRSQSRADPKDSSRSHSRVDVRDRTRSQSRPHHRDALRSHSPADTRRTKHKPNPYYYGHVTESEPNSRPGTSRESEDRMREDKLKGDRYRTRANSKLNSTRFRSNSEHSQGRSRSRNDRYRDDHGDGMNDGTSRMNGHYPEPSPAIPEQYASLPLDPHRQPLPELPVNAVRIPPSRPDAATFEQKGLWPPPKQVGLPSPRPSPRPSPGFERNGLFPPGGDVDVVASSVGQFPRASPGMGGMSPGLMGPSSRSNAATQYGQNPTPPVSAGSTPVTSPFFANNSNISLAATPSIPFPRNHTTRKRSVQKSAISEPKLISTTSVIDTVALPAGASLSNGMDKSASSLLAANGRRKLFGFGRNELDAPETAIPASYEYSSYSSDEREKRSRSRPRPRKSSSDGAKIGSHIRAQQQGVMMQSSPSLPLQHPQSSHSRGAAVEGGMF